MEWGIFLTVAGVSSIPFLWWWLEDAQDRLVRRLPVARVDAVRDYVQFKADTRLEYRRVWEDEYRRMLATLGVPRRQFLADCAKARVSITEGNSAQVIPPDFRMQVREVVETVVDRIPDPRIGYRYYSDWTYRRRVTK